MNYNYFKNHFIFYIFHWKNINWKLFYLFYIYQLNHQHQTRQDNFNDRTIKVGIQFLLAHFHLHSQSPPQSNAWGICEARFWVPTHCNCFACWFCGIRAPGCKLLFCSCAHSLLDSRRHFKAFSRKDTITARSAHRVFRPFLLGCSSLHPKTKENFCTLRSKSWNWNLQHAANPDFILHICACTVCTCTNKKKPEPEPELHLRLRWLRTRMFFSNPLQHIYRFDLENHDNHDDTQCFKLKLEQHGGRKLPILRPRCNIRRNNGRLLTSIGAK